MISVKYRGRLGNNMFQRGIAEIFSNNVKIMVNDTNLPGLLRRIMNNSLDGKTDGKTDGKIVLNDLELFGNTIFLKHLGAMYTNIHFEGFFQRSFLYLNRRDFFRSFYLLPHCKKEVEKDDVAVCVRRGDVTNTRFAIPLEYYNYVIEKHFASNPLYIFTDSKDNVDVLSLADKYNVKGIVSGDEIEDLSHLVCFDKIISGNSTLHWWAIFLGHATDVFLPLDDSAIGFMPDANNPVDLYLPFANYVHYSKYVR